jgi:hypothetical protein
VLYLGYRIYKINNIYHPEAKHFYLEDSTNLPVPVALGSVVAADLHARGSLTLHEPSLGVKQGQSPSSRQEL